MYDKYLPILPGRVAQSVTCLAADICLTVDPGVASSIQTPSHTFTEIDHEIISTAILLHPADSRRVVILHMFRHASLYLDIDYVLTFTKCLF